MTLKTPKGVDSDKGLAFRGKVKAKGAKLGKRGKRLEIQVRVGEQVEDGRQVYLGEQEGQVQARLQVHRRSTRYAIDYQFRAAVLKERGFPYLPSKSTKRTVTVTP